MQPDTCVFRCLKCRQPAEKCRCVEEAYACRECSKIEQSKTARRRRKILDSSGLPRWDYVTDWRCRRCQLNARQRTAYKTQKARAISQERQAKEVIWKHPMHEWSKRARGEARTLEYRMRVKTDLPTLVRAYYYQYANFLNSYADSVDAAIARRAEFDPEGPLGYPPGHRPTIKDVQARLPVEHRRELYALAHAADMEKARHVWGRINKRYRT